MSDILVSLDRILPNPWQTRQAHTMATTLENIARAVLSNAVQWDAVRLGQHNIAAELAAWREKVGWVATPGNPDATTSEEE